MQNMLMLGVQYLFKGGSPISNIQFSDSFQESSLISYKFKIWVTTLKPFGIQNHEIALYIKTLIYKAILWFTVAYISLCKLNYGYHNQALFHQNLPKETYFSHKIEHGLWEKYDLYCDTKISKSLKKLKKIGLGSFKSWSLIETTFVTVWTARTLVWYLNSRV